MEKGNIFNIDHVMIYLLLIFGAVAYYLSFNPVSKEQDLIKISRSLKFPLPKPKTPVEIDELEEALSAASTPNKTVIITVVNKAYVEGDKPMLNLFLDGFWIGEGTRELIDHLLVVAMDRTSHERCEFLKLHCYKLETQGVNFDGEKLYMSDDFIKMMWRRTQFLGDVLRRGYDFIFTDTDVIWLRNPFPRLINQNQSPPFDLQISVDKTRLKLINTGFYMIRSNNKTIHLFDTWHSKKENSTGLKEQDVLNDLMRIGFFKKLGIRARFLKTVYFSGFCQDSRNVSAVVTVHANCCRRISAKLADLTAVVHDWRRYKGFTTVNETASFRWTRHRACWSSWLH